MSIWRGGRVPKALRQGALFGALFAAGNLGVRVVPALVRGDLTLLGALEATGLTFLLFGGLAFALVLAGGRPIQTGNVEISPWFAVLFIGTIVAFFVGLIFSEERPVLSGIAAALGWVLLLAAMRMLVRRRWHRGA